MIPLLWLTHAIAFFTHEYAHSFTAWAFGAKGNPVAIHYGQATVSNILMQGDIDENVDYDPIFAAGRGWLAALIALAGMLLGNGGLYLISRAGLARAKRMDNRGQGVFWLLLGTMCVGNFIDYVPNRTFSTHGDMVTAERGLHCSPWWIAVVLGVPLLAVCWHHFARVLPRAAARFWRNEPTCAVILAVLAVVMFTEFFGRAGFDGYGPVAHRISAFWVYIVPAPLLWYTLSRLKKELSARPT